MQTKLATSKEATRQEALRLAKELKQIKLEQQFASADKDKLEEQKWKELAKGAERATAVRQQVVVAASKQAEQVAVDQRKLTLLNAYKAQKAKTDFQIDYDRRLSELKTIVTEERNIEIVQTREQAQATKAYQSLSTALLKTHNPYATRFRVLVTIFRILRNPFV